MNNETARRLYAEGEDLPLPYKSDFGFIINKANGYCSSCNKELTDVKGKINEYSSCFELRMIGLCHDCKLIVMCCPMRYYNDGRVMVKTELGWTEYHCRSHPSKLKWILIVLGIIGLSIVAFLL